MAPHPLLQRACLSTLRSHKFAALLPFRALASSVFSFLLSLLWSSFFSSFLFPSLLWLFPSQLFHLSTASEVCLLNFLRQPFWPFCSYIPCAYRQSTLCLLSPDILPTIIKQLPSLPTKITASWLYNLHVPLLWNIVQPAQSRLC